MVCSGVRRGLGLLAEVRHQGHRRESGAGERSFAFVTCETGRGDRTAGWR